MQIPLNIRLARERVATFRREVAIYIEHGENKLDNLWPIVRPIRQDSLDYLAPSINLIAVVDDALSWANTYVSPTASILREALSILEETLRDWEASWIDLGKAARTVWPQLADKHWIHDAVRAAIRNHAHASQSLRRSWPVASEELELQALKDMAGGEYIEADDAFTQLAGKTKAEWEAMLRERKGRNLPDGGRG